MRPRRAGAPRSSRSRAQRGGGERRAWLLCVRHRVVKLASSSVPPRVTSTMWCACRPPPHSLALAPRSGARHWCWSRSRTSPAEHGTRASGDPIRGSAPRSGGPPSSWGSPEPSRRARGGERAGSRRALASLNSVGGPAPPPPARLPRLVPRSPSGWPGPARGWAWAGPYEVGGSAPGRGMVGWAILHTRVLVRPVARIVGVVVGLPSPEP